MPLLPSNIEEIKQSPMPETIDGYQDLVSVLFEYSTRIEEDNRLLRSKLFGRSSERYVNPDQPSMFSEVEDETAEDELEEASETEISSHKRRKRRGQIELPEDLKRDTRLHELSEEERLCACCGKPMKEIGEDRTEKIDVVPASISVIEDVYKKYACPDTDCDGTPSQAPRLPVAIPKIKASEGTLAFLPFRSISTLYLFIEWRLYLAPLTYPFRGTL